MAGFTLPPKPVTIAFEDGSDYTGLEVEVNLRASLDYFFEMVALLESNKDEPAEFRDKVRDWADRQVLGWNLADRKGKAIPFTASNFTGHLDPATIGVLIGKWLRAMQEPPPDFSEPPGSGGTSKAPKA